MDSTTYVVVDSEIVHVRRLINTGEYGKRCGRGDRYDTVCSEA